MATKRPRESVDIDAHVLDVDSEGGEQHEVVEEVPSPVSASKTRIVILDEDENNNENGSPTAPHNNSTPQTNLFARLWDQIGFLGVSSCFVKEETDLLARVNTLSTRSRVVMLCLLQRRKSLFSEVDLRTRYFNGAVEPHETILQDAVDVGCLHHVDVVASLQECLEGLTCEHLVAIFVRLGVPPPPKAVKRTLIETLSGLAEANHENQFFSVVGNFYRLDLQLRTLFHYLTDLMYVVMQKGSTANPTQDTESGNCQRAFLVLEALKVNPEKLPTSTMVIENTLLTTTWRQGREDLDRVVFAMRCCWSISSALQLKNRTIMNSTWFDMNWKIVQSNCPMEVGGGGGGTAPSPHLQRVHPTYMWLLVAVELAQCAELVHAYGRAATLWKHVMSYPWFRPHKRGFYTLRYALDMEHEGKKESAMRAIEALLGINNQKPSSNGGQCSGSNTIRLCDRIALERTLRKLYKPPARWGTPPSTKLNEPRVVAMMGLRDAATRKWIAGQAVLSVEDYVMQNYLALRGPNYRGAHCEGSLLSGLFQLLLWDVTFMQMSKELNSFVVPYQTTPLDYGTAHFVKCRQNKIRRLFQSLEALTPQGMADYITASYAQHIGTVTGHSWDLFELATLRRVGAALQKTRSVVPILQHGLSEFKFGGLPDLWIWSHDEANEPDLIVVEVKAPNDSLSEAQIAWNHVLVGAGVHVEVCHVEETEPM
eukprot:PhF_6_TR37588/c0_g1_i1/m.55771/K15363/FAN1, MTMR15; fanconi-associated nuclease 1